MRSTWPRLFLIGVLAVAVPVQAQEAADTSEQVQGSRTTTLNPLSRIDPASLSGFHDRPLFSPTRRRPVEAPVSIASPNDASEELAEQLPQLLGILIAPDGATAHLLAPDGGTRHTVRNNDIIDGWSIDRITPDGVTVKRKEETRTLMLFKKPEQ